MRLVYGLVGSVLGVIGTVVVGTGTNVLSDGLTPCGPQGCGAGLTPYVRHVLDQAPAVGRWFLTPQHVVTLVACVFMVLVARVLLHVSFYAFPRFPTLVGCAALLVVCGPVSVVGRSWEARQVLTDGWTMLMLAGFAAAAGVAYSVGVWLDGKLHLGLDQCPRDPASA